jgi:hypothetical protein
MLACPDNAALESLPAGSTHAQPSIARLAWRTPPRRVCRSARVRALLTFAALLIVLAVIALSARSQLQANKRFLPDADAASQAASAPFGGSSQPTPAQLQRELEKTLREGAQRGAERAASAGEDGTR